MKNKKENTKINQSFQALDIKKKHDSDTFTSLNNIYFFEVSFNTKRIFEEQIFSDTQRRSFVMYHNIIPI